MDIMHSDTDTQTLSRDELVSRACTALWFCLAAIVAVLALSTLAFAQAPAPARRPSRRWPPMAAR